MKVLWFSNTPANADEYFNRQLKGTGGWLKSLDVEMQHKVDLHIAFYHKDKVSSFKYKNTVYHPIFQWTKNLFCKYLNAIRSKVVFKEDVNKYLNIINKVKPDIIHIHGTENPFGYIINIVDVPVVISIQGNITVYYHKYLSGIEKKYLNLSLNYVYSLIGYKNFKSGYKNFFHMKKREKEILRTCLNVIGRTFWDRRISSVLAPNARYYHGDEVLREGFYTHIWKYKKHDKFVIFTTNGNRIYKGFETLCQSISILIEAGFTKFEWQVAGVSDESHIVNVVKKKLGELYPKQALKVLGSLHEQELIDNLLGSNLYVMPSHIENSPNNLCEAMILGMPCVATFAGGTGSILSDKKEGLLVQDGDPWAMAGAILEIANNPDQAIIYGENARKTALKRHNKDKIVNDLLSTYKIIAQN